MAKMGRATPTAGLDGGVRVRVFVEHVSQKKAKQGFATLKVDLELVLDRLKAAGRAANGLES